MPPNRDRVLVFTIYIIVNYVRTMYIYMYMYWNLYCENIFLAHFRILVETPGEYGSLEEYFRHYRSPQQPGPLSPRTFSDPGLLGSNDLPTMTVSYMYSL